MNDIKLKFILGSLLWR